MFKKFIDIGVENLSALDYFLGGLSFFVVSIGGILIGLVFALTVSYITKLVFFCCK